MTTQQQPRDELVAALGQIAELHRTVPVYPFADDCGDPTHDHDDGDGIESDNGDDLLCGASRPIGHHCPVCGHGDPDAAIVELERFACRTAELAALALMRETLTGTGTEQVTGRG
jgi:hypothetical protein